MGHDRETQANATASILAGINIALMAKTPMSEIILDPIITKIKGIIEIKKPKALEHVPEICSFSFTILDMPNGIDKPLQKVINDMGAIS